MKEKEYYLKKIAGIKDKNPFVSNTDIAYQLLLDDIMEAVLLPDEKIPQDMIAELFDMSKTPVRDALLRLEKNRFIVKSEKAGYQVYHVSFKDFLDFCNFRLLIEAQAAYYAASSITEEELRKLAENIKKYNRYCEEQDLKKVLQFDEEFHEMIIKASHNPFLYEAYCSYNSKKKFYLTSSISEHKNFDRMKNKHNDIYEAIAHNREKEAKERMESHLSLSINYFD